ncbi:cytochrome C [Rhodobacteraceae bacterium W635]|uniref:c-type cytochrome n=1 Tax=Nioella halotolerans TaxID=2303578 RepID=UPI000E3CEA2C|nr:cytochrome C [Rhodobacteraceae bacterium W635]
MTRALVAITFAVLAGAPAALAQEGDPERGAILFRQCNSCHVAEPDGPARTGPNLYGVIGRTAGTLEDTRYSPAMREAGENGLVWTQESLDGFLQDPRGYMPGSRMSFRGMRDLQDRMDVIAFLTGDAPMVHSAGIERISADILAMEGDVEYGRYLSSECVACHSEPGDDEGIPAITGIEQEAFILAMHDYRDGHREHQVMTTVTQRLTNEEIASLAAYFAEPAE